MSRSIYKGPYVEVSLIRRVKKERAKQPKPPITVRTYSRSSTIIPSFLGMYFEVYNGRRFIKFYVNENMIGRKLGEFSHTRNFSKHSGDKGAGGRASAKGRKKK